MYLLFWIFFFGFFSEFDCLYCEFDEYFGVYGGLFSICLVVLGIFLVINVGNMLISVEVYVFVLGLDVFKFDVIVDCGVLSILGECFIEFQLGQVCSYSCECFIGSFCCVVVLFDDVDVLQVNVSYCDGVLCISIVCQVEVQFWCIIVQ